MQKKITIEDVGKTLNIILGRLDGFATKNDLKLFANKDDLKSFATKDDLKLFATKDDLKLFATKDDLKLFATKDDLKKETEEMAIMFKESFDQIDFKFAVIDDRFHDMDKRFDRMDKRFDKIESEVIKTNDSFARLKNYVDCEIAAVRGHLIRVDEKIGLANT
jgi:hypothetical protein